MWLVDGKKEMVDGDGVGDVVVKDGVEVAVFF